MTQVAASCRSRRHRRTDPAAMRGTPRCRGRRCSVTDHRRAGVPVPAGRDEEDRARGHFRRARRRTGRPARSATSPTARRPGWPRTGAQPGLGLGSAARRARSARWTTRDSQYRTLREHDVHRAAGQADRDPVPELDGTFNPAKIADFDRLSEVPLGPYQPTAATPASPASRSGAGRRRSAAEPQHGRPGDPAGAADHHPGRAARAGEQCTTPAARTRADPISVIRVRVAGVTGAEPGLAQPDQGGGRADRAAHRADRGHRRRVIPRAHHRRVPAGRYGTARAAATEGWVKKGVAVAILTAVDRRASRCSC